MASLSCLFVPTRISAPLSQNHSLIPNTMSTATLPLDAESLRVEDLSLPALMREINLQKRPNWLLRCIMNALEAKRQEKGMGWSRAWNKKGLNVFRTHVQTIENDADYFCPVAPILNQLLPLAPPQYQSFAAELMADPSMMAFTFYHNHDLDGLQHEGLTLSFGRKITDDPGKRDRLDLILEDRRIDGRVDGRLDRVRFYICPWSEYKNDKTHFALEKSDFSGADLTAAQDLYESCVRFYHTWKSDEARQWSHWSARYIEYFGARSFIPVGSSFA